MKGSGGPLAAPPAAIFILLAILPVWYPLTTHATPPVIGFTKEQMSLNEVQFLSVLGGCGGPYAWSIVSGGGSLSASGGNSLTYAAPALNPQCLANATGYHFSTICKTVSNHFFYLEG
jgi:hypothetical protein